MRAMAYSLRDTFELANCAPYNNQTAELPVRGAELLGGGLNRFDIASHVALQVRHVDFRGHLISVADTFDVAAVDQFVQPLRDHVARAADHTADLGCRCRLAFHLSDQNMGSRE